MIDKLDRAFFFQKTCLLANINIKIVLEMLFVTFSNIDI